MSLSKDGHEDDSTKFATQFERAVSVAHHRVTENEQDAAGAGKGTQIGNDIISLSRLGSGCSCRAQM